VSLGTYGEVAWTAPSLLVLALGSRGPDRPARMVSAETSADRFLHQLTGEASRGALCLRGSAIVPMV